MCRGYPEVTSLYYADLIYLIDGGLKEDVVAFASRSAALTVETEIWPKSASPRITGHLVDDRHDCYSGRKSSRRKDECGRRSLFPADYGTIVALPLSLQKTLLFGFCHNVSHCVHVTYSSC